MLCIMIKVNLIPVQAWRGPEDSSRLRLPDFKKFNILKWQCRKPYAPAAFTSRRHYCFSFLLERLSPPQSHNVAGKFYVNEKSKWPNRETNPRPSDLYRAASTNFNTDLYILLFNSPLHRTYVRPPTDVITMLTTRTSFSLMHFYQHYHA